MLALTAAPQNICFCCKNDTPFVTSYTEFSTLKKKNPFEQIWMFRFTLHILRKKWSIKTIIVSLQKNFKFNCGLHLYEVNLLLPSN